MQSNTLFWLINTAGWFTFLLSSGLFFAYLSGGINWHSLYIQLFAFIYYVPVSGILRSLIKRMGWFESKQHLRLIAVLLLITFLMALLGQFLISLYMMYGLELMTWANYSIAVLLMTMVQNWIVLCTWTLLFLVIKHVRNSREQQIKQIQLESTLQATELMALKAQLNPHFIFNCLNNMRALAIDDGETTRKMITHLSEILKYSFQFGEQSQVSVVKELQHVKNYLALEGIQFEDRLSYDFSVDAVANDALIPTLSIQLLVENAIKHGIMGLSKGGHIQINISSINQQLLITVTNSGQLEDKPTKQSTGIGLVNLKKRLQLLYGNQASLQIEQLNDESVTAKINLPLEKCDVQ